MDTTANLTALETKLLAAWPTNYNSADAEKSDNASWNDVRDFAKAVDLSQKVVKGALGSLVKKGLVEGGHERANGEAGELQVLTEAGIDAVFAIRAAKVPPVLVPMARQVADTLAFIAAQVEPEAAEPAAATVNPEPSPEAAPARDRRNGVLRPVEGSVSAKIWALVDAFVAEHGREPKPAEIKDAATAQGINLTSLGLGMGYRRKFHREG